MANSPQARKRAKQNSVRRVLKHSQRSQVRTAIKKLEAAITGGDSEAAKAAYTESVAMIDRATVKGLHHKNRAARLKSRLNKRVKLMSA
ncbi:30S ribosomal protein S20 [Arenicella sp.]|nr:30S ribosomal protein S20 [Arenicella sp.]